VDFSPIDALKQILRDQGNTFLSADEYEQIIGGFAASEAT